MQSSNLLDGTLNLYTSRIINASIEVERRYREARPLLCFGGEIRQVLINLVGNALDAMLNGGRLFLRSREMTELRTGRRGVRLTVADTGYGISEATREKLLEPSSLPREIGARLWGFGSARKSLIDTKARSAFVPAKRTSIVEPSRALLAV